ncbi:MAG: hypothetical protein J7J52_03360, partial [Deltaproteobacteria bacterium]|nr:hypothetical protein [Deltaproteobacteria bacterium]
CKKKQATHHNQIFNTSKKTPPQTGTMNKKAKNLLSYLYHNKPLHNVLLCPISVQNIQYIPQVKIFTFPEPIQGLNILQRFLKKNHIKFV